MECGCIRTTFLNKNNKKKKQRKPIGSSSTPELNKIQEQIKSRIRNIGRLNTCINKDTLSFPYVKVTKTKIKEMMGDCNYIEGEDFIENWLKRFAEEHLALVVNSKELHKIKGKILQPSDMKLILVENLEQDESLFSESISVYEIKRSRCENISNISKESMKSTSKELKLNLSSCKDVSKKIEKTVCLSPIKRADSPVSFRSLLAPPSIEHKRSLKTNSSIDMS